MNQFLLPVAGTYVEDMLSIGFFINSYKVDCFKHNKISLINTTKQTNTLHSFFVNDDFQNGEKRVANAINQEVIKLLFQE